MFHDIGITKSYRGGRFRFEVDGANAARDFLQSHGISKRDIGKFERPSLSARPQAIPEGMPRRSSSSPGAINSESFRAC
jgi:HD superfamily phosphodiesterase